MRALLRPAARAFATRGGAQTPLERYGALVTAGKLRADASQVAVAPGAETNKNVSPHGPSDVNSSTRVEVRPIERESQLVREFDATPMP